MMNWDLRCEATISMLRPRASWSFHRSDDSALACRPVGRVAFGASFASVGTLVLGSMLWGPASASMPKLTA